MCFTESPVLCTGYTTRFSTTNEESSISLQSCLCTFPHREVPVSCIGGPAASSNLHGSAFTPYRNGFVRRVHRPWRSFFLSALTWSPTHGLCTTECFTVIKAKVTKSLMSILLVYFTSFRACPSPQPTHMRTYPTPLVLPSGVIVRLYQDVEGAQISPPVRAPTSEHASHGFQHRARSMTMTMSTLIEDVSNKCWSSGPVDE